MAFHPVHPSYDPNSLTFFSLPCVFFPSLVTTFLMTYFARTSFIKEPLFLFWTSHFFSSFPVSDTKVTKHRSTIAEERHGSLQLHGQGADKWAAGMTPPPPSPPPSISHTVLSSPTLSTTPVRSMSPSPALLHQASRLSILWKNHLGAPPPV